jgi:hypothetical protein
LEAKVVAQWGETQKQELEFEQLCWGRSEAEVGAASHSSADEHDGGKQ